MHVILGQVPCLNKRHSICTSPFISSQKVDFAAEKILSKQFVKEMPATEIAKYSPVLHFKKKRLATEIAKYSSVLHVTKRIPATEITGETAAF